jgi:FAD dependent oxidoreductase TIGR03364
VTGSFDLIVVGSGIVGLSHAAAANRIGLRVCVVDRDRRPTGASVRNFGMIWPIGTPAGELRRLSLRSVQLWLKHARECGLHADACGSLHLAYRDDELRVLREFLAGGSAPEGCELWAADEILARVPGVRAAGLLGGLRSVSELAVDPRAACDRLGAWLESRGVVFARPAAAVEADSGMVRLASGDVVRGGCVIVCTGADFETLLPQVYRDAPVTKCKLMMLRLCAPSWRTGMHIAGGLTLRHYRAFDACPSIADLRARIAREHPFLDGAGIHVMASQQPDGTLIVGDSHEYGRSLSPFDNAAIETTILGCLSGMLDITDLSVIERWHGVYSRRTDGQPLFRAEPIPGVHVVTCLSGAGMTLGPAVGEWVVAELFQTSDVSNGARGDALGAIR